jgi:uncharacterized delta-60 repeat protein
MNLRLALLRHCAFVLSLVAVIPTADAGVPPNDSDFDASFGVGGSVRYATTLDGVRRRADDVVLLTRSDGDFVLVGASEGAGTDRLEIRRIRRATGQLEPSFGSAGLVQVPAAFVGPSGGAAIDADDAVYVFGALSNAAGNSDFAVMRFRADGSRDLDYGVGGFAIVDFGPIAPGFGRERAGAAKIGADGKLVLVGSSYDQTFNNGLFAIARLRRDGTIDTSFSPPSGRIAFPIIPGREAEASALDIDPRDGTIYVAGSVKTGVASNEVDPALAKLTPAGTLDPSFCPALDVTDGLCVTHPSASGGRRTFIHAPANAGFGNDSINSVLVDRIQNRVLLGGSLTNTNAGSQAPKLSFGIVSARTSDGRDQPSFKPVVQLFGPPGTYLSFISSINAMTFDSAQRLMLVGDFDAVTSQGSISLALVMRLRPNLTLDTSFFDAFNFEAQSGHVYFQIADFGPVSYTRASAVAMDGSRIVFAGEADSATPNASDFYLARLRGTPDPIFAHGFD